MQDEELVKTLGRWWRDFRTKSIEWMELNPESASKFTDWRHYDGGLYADMDGIDQIVNKSTYGIIHSDNHLENFKIQAKDDGSL